MDKREHANGYIVDISHSDQTDDNHYYLLGIEEQPVDSNVSCEDKTTVHYQPLSNSEELENEEVRADKRRKNVDQHFLWQLHQHCLPSFECNTVRLEINNWHVHVQKPTVRSHGQCA